MDKKLYDELVNRNIITDTFMTLEKINERGIKLEDIITQPEMYKVFSKYATSEEAEEIVKPVEDQPATKSVEDKATPIEPKEEEVVAPVEDSKESAEETDDIVVDDEPEVSVEVTEEKPKTKKSKKATTESVE